MCHIGGVFDFGPQGCDFFRHGLPGVVNAVLRTVIDEFAGEVEEIVVPFFFVSGNLAVAEDIDAQCVEQVVEGFGIVFCEIGA